MIYELEIVIDLPRSKVIELFDNADNMKKWQKGLISFETIEGTPGETGAKAKLNYEMGKRKIEMIETITKSNFPDEFFGTYEAKGVWNEVKNHFTSIDKTKTMWRTEQVFRFSGFMKIIALFMPSAFRKQSFTYMKDFKTFAESE